MLKNPQACATDYELGNRYASNVKVHVHETSCTFEDTWQRQQCAEYLRHGIVLLTYTHAKTDYMPGGTNHWATYGKLEGHEGYVLFAD